MSENQPENLNSLIKPYVPPRLLRSSDQSPVAATPNPHVHRPTCFQCLCTIYLELYTTAHSTFAMSCIIHTKP